MKKLFFIIGLFFSLSAMAQPTNYTKINMRYRWLSGMFDSALYVPRYNGTPSGVRVNETSVFDGMVAMDTTNNRLYIYSGGAWVRLANYSEIAAYTAGNGLTLSGSQFKLGGTLTDDTTLINQDNKRLRFYGNETMFDSLRLTSAGESDYTIRHRLVGLGFPVTTIKPTGNSSKNIAFDIMPTGTPGNYSDNGIAWIDVCDSDVSAGAVATATARIGITSSAVQFGSRAFGGASDKPIQFVIGSSTKAQIDASTNTASLNIGKITQSQDISSDYVGYSLINQNNTTSGGDAIFFVGQSVGSLTHGFLRYNNNSSATQGAKNPNSFEIAANASATGGLNIASLANTRGKIKFFIGPSGGVEAMRIDSNRRVGIGTTTPLRLLHTNGAVRHESLGTASTDTTTYKPLGIDTNGDLIPMANWPQQKINLVFGAGSGADGDTTAFTTSAIYGSFYNDADTIVVTSMRSVLQGTSPDVTYKVWYNDSLNVEAGATALVTAGSQVTNTTTGTNVTSFDVTKIPPGVWVWVKTSTVATKPKYFSLTINGYRK